MKAYGISNVKKKYETYIVDVQYEKDCEKISKIFSGIWKDKDIFLEIE